MFAKAILRDPHQAIEGNKFYLAGINESLVNDWETDLAPKSSPEDSLPLFDQGLQTHRLAPRARSPNIPDHRHASSASANDSQAHLSATPRAHRSSSHAASSLAQRVAQPLLAALFEPMDGAPHKRSHEPQSQIPGAQNRCRNSQSRSSEKLRLRQQHRRRPHARVCSASPSSEPIKAPGARRATKQLANIPLDRSSPNHLKFTRSAPGFEDLAMKPSTQPTWSAAACRRLAHRKSVAEAPRSPHKKQGTPALPSKRARKSNVLATNNPRSPLDTLEEWSLAIRNRTPPSLRRLRTNHLRISSLDPVSTPRLPQQHPARRKIRRASRNHSRSDRATRLVRRTLMQQNPAVRAPLVSPPALHFLLRGTSSPGPLQSIATGSTAG